MTSIPQTQTPDNYHVMSSYTAMSKGDLIEIIETQKRRINELQWHDEIMSNTDLPIAARFAARAVRKFTQTRAPCDDGYYKGYLPAMADLAGVSASTISRGLETLSDATEAIDKHTDEIRDERGRLEKNLLYFRTNESFNAAAQIIPIKELPKHGGNRRLPCECGCVHRLRKVVEECAACGHKFYENERIIRGDEESLQLETTESSYEQIDNPESLQVATLPVDTQGSIASCNASEELQALPQWVVWKYEQKPGKAKPDKVPYNVHRADENARADVSNPETWSTYPEAIALLERSQKWFTPYAGVGFVFKKGGGIVGIDYDNSLAVRIHSYSEISVSGNGVHSYVHGSIPKGTRRNGVEMYDAGRFFTWTGNHLAGTPETIEDCQAELDALYKELAPPQEQIDFSLRKENFTCSRSDEEILDKARNARNGAKFRDLYDRGSWKSYGYPSQSEADEGLCRMLAYWCDNNVSTIIRLFEKSGLNNRKKWERDDYREQTISKAIGQNWQVAS